MEYAAQYDSKEFQKNQISQSYREESCKPMQGKLEAALDYQRSSLERVIRIIVDLRDKLTPILAPRLEKSNSREKLTEISSPVIGRIGEHNQIIDDVGQQLEGLLRSVEV